jgi:hypothetical protein
MPAAIVPVPASGKAHFFAHPGDVEDEHREQGGRMFRSTGSVSCFMVEGRVPDPASSEFAAALAGKRFNSIETAASEQVSMGWVTPCDPTGDSFEPADMDGEHARWLRVRIDKKSLPPAWVTIHR